MPDVGGTGTFAISSAPTTQAHPKRCVESLFEVLFNEGHRLVVCKGWVFLSSEQNFPDWRPISIQEGAAQLLRFSQVFARDAVRKVRFGGDPLEGKTHVFRSDPCPESTKHMRKARVFGVPAAEARLCCCVVHKANCDALESFFQRHNGQNLRDCLQPENESLRGCSLRQNNLRNAAANCPPAIGGPSDLAAQRLPSDTAGIFAAPLQR